jgi:hypothetical protein
VGVSGSECCLRVEALDHAVRDPAFGPEPVEDKRLMAPQHAGDALHRPDLRSHRARAPGARTIRGFRNDARVFQFAAEVVIRTVSGRHSFDFAEI